MKLRRGHPQQKLGGTNQPVILAVFVSAVATYLGGLCEIALPGGLPALNGLLGLVFRACPSHPFSFRSHQDTACRSRIEPWSHLL
ncbi:hypothetical protein BDV12DRAFT_170342 [Aspergillus spectabilis]